MAKNEKNVVKQEVPEENTESNIFTYVGVGADSPFRIKFMGRQEFVRGKPQEVTDPELLAKIVGNPSFVRV